MQIVGFPMVWLIFHIDMMCIISFPDWFYNVNDWPCGPLSSKRLHTPSFGGPCGRVVKVADFSALDHSIISPLWVRASLGARVTCGTSQVLLAGVSGGFSPGTPVFAPPTDWSVSIWVKKLERDVKLNQKKKKKKKNISYMLHIYSPYLNAIPERIKWVKWSTPACQK